MHPELVNTLVVSSIGFRQEGYHEEVRPPGRPGSRRMPTERDFGAMVAAYRRVAPAPAHFPEIAAKVSAAVGAFEGWSPDELRAIGAPTLILAGDTDSIRPEHAIALHGLIPNAQLPVLPGTTRMRGTPKTDRRLSP